MATSTCRTTAARLCATLLFLGSLSACQVASDGQVSREALTPTQEDALKEQALPRRATLAPIDTQAAAAVETLDAARLSKAQREALAKTSLPVLLPDDDALLAKAKITASADFYGASMRMDGHAVYLHATRQRFAAEGHPAVGDAGVVSRSEEMASLSFVRFGVAYHLEVSCDDPGNDPRCTQDAYLQSLARRLARVEVEP